MEADLGKYRMLLSTTESLNFHISETVIYAVGRTSLFMELTKRCILMNAFFDSQFI